MTLTIAAASASMAAGCPDCAGPDKACDQHAQKLRDIFGQQVKERSLIASGVATITDRVYAESGGFAGTVDHCVDDEQLLHGLHLHVSGVTGAWRLLVSHPRECACDALTNEFVLHG